MHKLILNVIFNSLWMLITSAGLKKNSSQWLLVLFMLSTFLTINKPPQDPEVHNIHTRMHHVHIFLHSGLI